MMGVSGDSPNRAAADGGSHHRAAVAWVSWGVKLGFRDKAHTQEERGSKQESWSLVPGTAPLPLRALVIPDSQQSKKKAEKHKPAEARAQGPENKARPQCPPSCHAVLV